MRVWVAALICVAAQGGFSLAAAAQEEHPQQQKPARTQETFFSGNVVSFDAEQVTVTRRTLTLSWVTKTFLLSADTKIEGTLKAKARVTVKFVKTEDGDKAVHVLVR